MNRTPRTSPAPTRRPTAVAALAAAVLGVGLLAAPASAQQQSQDQGPSGEAVVRQRTGPEVKVEQGQSPRVLVLFTSAQGSPQNGGQGGQSAGGNAELVLLSRPTPQEGEQQQAQPQQPGTEIVFPAANARDGVVSYAVDAGSPRTFTVLARKPGETLQVREVTRSADVVVMKVIPSQEKLQAMQQEAQSKRQEQMTQAQTQAEQAGNQAAQQVAAKPAEKSNDAQGEQQADAAQQGGQQANAQPQGGQAQPASAQQDQKPQRTPEQQQAYQTAYQKSMQQAQQKMSAQQQQEPTYAIVTMYLGEGAQ